MGVKRDIGKTLIIEFDLTSAEVNWLIGIGLALLRAFTQDDGQPMNSIAERLHISRQTLYTKLRWVVYALAWIDRNKQSIESLLNRIQQLENQLSRLQQLYATVQAEVSHLSKELAKAQFLIDNLQSEMAILRTQWAVSRDRLIVVLKMSGRCTVRGIVEVMDYGLGIPVSIGYVQGVIAQAGTNAHSKLEELLKVVTLSGAICIDEVYLKELGRKIWGVVIVDPLTGIILRFDRCEERSKNALEEVIQKFAESGFKHKIKLCLTDMYDGYLTPIKTHLPSAVHQYCWFHINCFHIGAAVRRARAAYKRAAKELASFDKKLTHPLSGAEHLKRQVLIDARDLALKYLNGIQKFQRLIKSAMDAPNLEIATLRLDRLIRVSAKVGNPYIRKIGTLLAGHRSGLLSFFTCLESRQHLLQRISTTTQMWVKITKLSVIPITTNAAEHVFRCLRRYTHSMDHFVKSGATQRFFDLFAFFHNMRTLRAGTRKGQSLLAAAQVNVKAHFGTDDLYTILGFPPASQAFSKTESVQSVSA